MKYRWFWGLLFAAHFLCVLVGAFALLPPEAKGGLVWVYESYGFLSGASAGYNFFAPEIGSELKMKFELNDSRELDHLENGVNREAELKVSTLAYLLSDSIQNEIKRKQLAASFAGKILWRHPQANQIKVLIESYDLPSMAEFRSGKREHWKTFYQATFAKK